MRHSTLLLALLLLTASTALPALEVKGVKLDDRVRLAPDGPELVLNGAGVRSKFFVSVYVGALYLPQPRRDAATVLGAVEPRRVAMHFLHDRVEAAKLRAAWEEGFADNQPPEALAALRGRLDAFKALFADAVAGDVILLDFVPGLGTTVTVNGSVAGNVPGDDFNRALLAVWFGDDPADSGLKRGLLGE